MDIGFNNPCSQQDSQLARRADCSHQGQSILLKGWILLIGGASAGEGLRLQPAQQACFESKLDGVCLVDNRPSTDSSNTLSNFLKNEEKKYVILYYFIFYNKNVEKNIYFVM